MTEQLKSCPCCGSLEATIKTMNVGTYRVFCEYCRLCIPGCESRSEAIEKWNTRADGWISVDSATPNGDCQVIVKTSSDNFNLAGIDITHYSETVLPRFGIERITAKTVTHWMPLPSAPAK